MSKSITLTITEEELAELEAVLDEFTAEIRKDKGEHDPSRFPGYEALDDRAKLEVVLDALIAERRADKGEHERAMARVDRNLAEIKEIQRQIRANLETPWPCGKDS